MFFGVKKYSLRKVRMTQRTIEGKNVEGKNDAVLLEKINDGFRT
jgi:hypothetical protein